MVKKTIELHLAKEIDPNEFYGAYQVGVYCNLNHPDVVLRMRRKNGYFEQDELIEVVRWKKSSFYYKWSALLRLFYWLDVNMVWHRQLLWLMK